MTLNDLERRNSPYFAFFSPNSLDFQADYITVVEDRPIMSLKYCLPVPVFRMQQFGCVVRFAHSNDKVKSRDPLVPPSSTNIQSRPECTALSVQPNSVYQQSTSPVYLDATSQSSFESSP